MSVQGGNLGDHAVGALKAPANSVSAVKMQSKQKQQKTFENLEHQLVIPGSTKTFQENVDLDLHLSASDRGRLVLHILKVGFRKESLCTHPSKPKNKNLEDQLGTPSSTKAFEQDPFQQGVRLL